MPYYQQRGHIPNKRHTQFRDKNGKLLFEELVSRQGFSSIYSNLYHLKMPTSLCKVGRFINMEYNKVSDVHIPRHILTHKLNAKNGDIITNRKLLFFNKDINIYKSHFNKNMGSFYRNGHFDDLLYIQCGVGTLETNFGNIEFIHGDYIIIPRGVIWKITQIKSEIKCLFIESRKAINTPKKYRNEFGQHLEHSPYCERDMKFTKFKEPRDEQGEHKLIVRTHQGFQEYYYKNHFFDVVGWDGYFFPWKINILDFEPITGSLHQPPPVHQMFESEGFVICSFVPRMFDYHPDSIPAPYPHSNVDSDEIIFYSKGDFMSRKGISIESITYHPMGIPHGPQPGKYEESIGKNRTDELAVMIDTFAPLNFTKNAQRIEDDSYKLSWI